MEVLIGTRFINHYVNSISCIDRHVNCTKGKIPLLGSARNEPTIKRLEFTKDEYRGPKTDTQTKKMNYYPEMMRHKVSLCKRVTLPASTQVRIKMVIKISASFIRNTRMPQRTARSVRSDNMINEVDGNKPFEIQLTIISTFEKKLSKGTVISNTTWSPVSHLGVTGTMNTEIRESPDLNLMVNHGTAALIRQPRTEVTALSFAAPYEEITNSTPINQESLLSRSVETELSLAPRQQDATVGSVKNKPASLQDW